MAKGPPDGHDSARRPPRRRPAVTARSLDRLLGQGRDLARDAEDAAAGRLGTGDDPAARARLRQAGIAGGPALGLLAGADGRAPARAAVAQRAAAGRGRRAGQVAYEAWSRSGGRRRADGARRPRRRRAEAERRADHAAPRDGRRRQGRRPRRRGGGLGHRGRDGGPARGRPPPDPQAMADGPRRPRPSPPASRAGRRRARSMPPRRSCRGATTRARWTTSTASPARSASSRTRRAPSRTASTRCEGGAAAP